MPHAVRVVAGKGDVNGAASSGGVGGTEEIRYDAHLDLWKRPRYRILIGWMGNERARRALDGVGGHSLTRKGRWVHAHVAEGSCRPRRQRTRQTGRAESERAWPLRKAG